jgi:hypothetical protein
MPVHRKSLKRVSKQLKTNKRTRKNKNCGVKSVMNGGAPRQKKERRVYMPRAEWNHFKKMGRRAQSRVLRSGGNYNLPGFTLRRTGSENSLHSLTGNQTHLKGRINLSSAASPPSPPSPPASTQKIAAIASAVHSLPTT